MTDGNRSEAVAITGSFTSNETQTGTKAKARPPVKKWLRNSAIAGLATAIAGVWAIQTQPAFGPWLADTGRALLGPELIAAGEELYYAAGDHLQRLRFARSAPAKMWESHDKSATATVSGTAAVTSTSGVATTSDTQAANTSVTRISSPEQFHPRDFTPPEPDMATPGDGHWEAWEAGPPGATPLIYRTQVHTDPKRTWSVVAIMALDLKRLELHSVPGNREPAGDNLPKTKTAGRIPQEDVPHLVAAFNGGWEAIHGHLGMKVGDLEILPPVSWGCGIAALADGTINIGSWQSQEKLYKDMRWFRQTPPCLVENGVENPRLQDQSKRWGAALSGQTVVRRSALGINADGTILYYALGDNLTAEATAKALEAAGAVNAAMLDINYSFPRFSTYITAPAIEEWNDTLPAKPEPAPGYYLSKPANKDFFYATMKSEDEAFSPSTDNASASSASASNNSTNHVSAIHTSANKGSISKASTNKVSSNKASTNHASLKHGSQNQASAIHAASTTASR